MKKRKILAAFLALAMIFSSLSGIVVNASAINLSDIQNVIEKIDTLDPTNADDQTMAEINAVQNAYDALSDEDKLFITNVDKLNDAYSAYYTAIANENDGKFVDIDFENGTASDVAGRITATMGSSTSVVDDGKYGDKSVSIVNSNSMNSMVGWKSDDYDPLLYSKDGASISMWVKFSSLSNDAIIFSYGLWGYRFYLGYTNGSLRVSARNYNSTTSEFNVSGLSNLIGADWTLLTVTCDTDNNYKVYFNDQLVGSQTLSFSLYDVASYGSTASIRSTTDNTYISYYSIDCAPYWSDRTNPVGLVDNFAIYNTALNPQQIAKLYDPNTPDPVPDMVAVNAVIDKINALNLNDYSVETLTAIGDAWTSYNALSDFNKTYVTNFDVLNNAYSDYYNNEADKNDGKFVDINFENGTASDMAGRITATMGSSTSVVDDGKYGDKSVSIANSNSMNSMVGWKSDNYDPLLYSKDGASISMWVNFSALSNDTPIFSYGFWGYRFYLGYTNGKLLVSTRNYNSTTSEFTVEGLSDLVGSDWTLLTVSCDADKNFKVYFDDQLVGSQTLSFSLYDVASYGSTASIRSTTDNTYISYYSIACAPYWSDRTNMAGSVDNFTIYNSDLSSAQVAMMYSQSGTYDVQKVQNTISLINAIPNKNDEGFVSALKAALSAYNSLSSYEQMDITNKDLLDAAIKEVPAVFYRFEGDDITKSIVEGNTILVLVKKGVDLSAVNAETVLSENSEIDGKSDTVWDMSEPFDITVTKEDGASTNYTVKPYSASSVTAQDRVQAYGVDSLCNDLPVYLYRSGMDSVADAINAYEALTDIQKLSMTNGQQAAATAVRMEELKSTPIRITCVGSSTCYGSGSTDPATDSFPAQMEALLGTNNCTVTNVGVPGATIVSTASVGIYSYMGTSEYTRGLQSDPDIVIMFVGSNDADGGRWNSDGYKVQFIKDYTTILQAYQNLDSHPQVILTYPYQSYSGDRATYIPEIMSYIDVIAEQYDCDIMDLYTVTNEMLNASNWDTYFNSDKLHPTTVGYAGIAKVAYDYIENELAPMDVFDVENIKIGGESLADFSADTYRYTVSYRGKSLPEITTDVGGDSIVNIVQPTAENPIGYVYVESPQFQYGRAYQINFEGISQNELSEQAALAVSALQGLTGISNSTTADGILNAVKTAFTTTTVTADWKSEPTITAATEDTEGSIVGTIVVTVDDFSSEVPVNLTISKVISFILGDLDNDKQVTVSDVVQLRKLIMSGNHTEQQLGAGDFNDDDQLTVSDIIALRLYIMTGAAID